MKDRLLTLALAAGAFALFYFLMLPKPTPPQETVTRPVTTERGPNGYLALMRWFESIGLEPLSLRERFTALDRLEEIPATGNLLISTAPHLYPPRDSEMPALREWIARGNTLLMVAGLSDTPEWAMEQLDYEFRQRMTAMTGLEFELAGAEDEESTVEGTEAEATEATEAEDAPQVEPEDEGAADNVQVPNPFARLAEPLEFSMVPNGEHPLLSDVKSVGALSEYPTSKWRASTSTMSDLILELASDPQTGEPVLWLVRYGEGQILVSAYGSVFVNKLIGKQDNARLLANIVQWSLASEGRVIIDDAHQGLVAFYDPEAFFGDKRLHVSLWWLVGLWLVFVLGSQRLRALGSRWQPVDVTGFVRASGGFLARVLKPSTAAQQLFANFFNERRRQLGLPVNGAPVWDWMATRAAITARDIEQLQDLHARAHRGQRIDLLKLQNLLLRVREQLN